MVEYQITNLSNNNFQNEDPQISGDKVVWEGNDQIFFYDGNRNDTITNNEFQNQDPQISGNNIVWEAFSFEGFSGKVDVFLFDGETTINTDSPGGTFNNDPQISGDNVVWAVNNEILLYNIPSEATTSLADTTFENKNPQISGNNVVWVGEDDSDKEIILYDGTQTLPITNNNFDDNNPQISGNNVVWEGNEQIFFYNIQTQEIKQVTNNNLDNEDPQISGQYIVWEAFDGNDEDIFLYNIETDSTTQLTDNDTNDEDPQISGGNVVWEGFDSNDEEIFLYNIDSGENSQITNNNFDDEDPQISGDNIVWEANDDIFLATPISTPTVIPVVNLSINPSSGSESDRTTFTITATANSAVDGTQTVEVDLTGNAIGDDFDGTIPTTITINNGATTGTIEVVVIDDELVEGEETATFTISSPSNGITLGSTTSVTATIQASDQPREDINLGDEGGTRDFSDRTANLNITAGSGEDNITSGSGDDNINSGGGNDIIDAGDGDNTIDAGTGDDEIIGSGESGTNNQIDGGEGIDRVKYSGARADFSVARFPGDIVRVGSNTDTLTNVEELQFTDQTVSVADLPTIALDDGLIRFRNSEIPTGTYLFAGSEEAAGIRQNFSPPFSEEGEAFKVSLEEIEGLVKFNRFRNNNISGTYIFASEEESVSIRENFPDAFTEEGTAFYALGADYNVGQDVIRFRNLNNNTYIFALGEEAQSIRDNFSDTFAEEGVAFEVVV